MYLVEVPMLEYKETAASDLARFDNSLCCTLFTKRQDGCLILGMIPYTEQYSFP